MAAFSVPVFDSKGKPVGEMEVDAASLGERVRPKLIKQAIVAYLDRHRQDSARTKGRSEVEGSTRKLYRQKGTGNARVGAIRTVVRRGGGVAFSKRGPRRQVELPKKMRRLARNSALLARIQAQDVMVLDSLSYSEPKTSALSSTLSSLGVDSGCLLAVKVHDRNVYLSGRNLPRTDVRIADELTAYEIMRRKKVILTRDALEGLLSSSGS